MMTKQCRFLHCPACRQSQM